MAVYRKSGSSWISTKSIYRKVSSSWVQVKAVYRKAGSSWIKVFSGGGPSIAQQVTISQSTNSSTGIVTLTGRNYRWSNASSLTYEFKRSRNGGISYTTIASGTATNPAVGSSNTYTYQLANNLSDVYPNVDNMYIFIVTAVSSANVTNTSESANPEYVIAARNVTNLSIVSADTTFDSVKLQFNGGEYASSYLVRYRKGIIDGYHHAISSGSPATITVPNLDSNTTYSFYVTPYTGGLVSSLVTGYAGNESSPVSGSTSVMPQPVKVSSPTLSGTGVAFTSITAGSGTYQSGSFGGITTKIVYYLSPYTAPTDGEGSSSATIMDTATPAPTHPISQEDATTPNKKFYARDEVTAVNGTTTYYYYSPVVTARVGTVTDTFDRTAVSSGLGTSSSGYVYSPNIHIDGKHASSSWSTNGSTANNSTNVTRYISFPNPGSAAVEYPIKALEVTSKTDLTASVEIPSGGGGPGIAFWMSGAGSFYAVAPVYSKINNDVTTTTYTCDGAVISTNSNGTNPTCRGCTVTTSTSGGTSSDCNATAFSTNSNGTSPNCYGCPITTSGGPSSDCNFPVNKSTDASGTGCFGCPITTNPGGTSYTCGSGTTYSYGSAIVAQAACHGCGYSDTSYVSKTCTGGPGEYADGTLSTACGGKCSCTGPFTRTTYGCTGSASGGSCPASSTSTYNASTVGTRCSACVRPIAGVNFFTWSTVAASNSTYYTCNTNVCTTVTQFSCTYATVATPTTYTCRGQDTSTPVTYTCKGRDTSTPVVTSYSCSPKTNNTTVVVSTYNTNLRIMSTGFTSYVAVLKDENINTNTSAFEKAYKISVTTSGNNISATAYSDLSGTVILGTASYTRGDGDLAKPATGAASYAGIIKTPSNIDSNSVDNNAGSTYDNLSIS